MVFTRSLCSAQLCMKSKHTHKQTNRDRWDRHATLTQNEAGLLEKVELTGPLQPRMDFLLIVAN